MNSFWTDKYAGYHTDLHLHDKDFHSGEEADPDLLYAQLSELGPDWVQVDSKGHPGYCSFRSRVPDASIAPGMKNNPVMAWREATERLGVPMICHYSDVIDNQAAAKHPEWEVVTPFDGGCNHVLCPRSDYYDKLLIPQACELLGDYRADGIWFDGDLWGFHGCWCPKCRAAFTEQTGIPDIPEKEGDANWAEWNRFQYQSHIDRINRNITEIHEKFPKVLLAVNWLGSHKYPNGRGLRVDWHSGDCAPHYSLDIIRREAPMYATQKEDWDIMSWPFTFPADLGLTIKPVEALQQEAAFITAYGGHWICCNAATYVRTSRQVDWHMPRLRKVIDFIHARKDVLFHNSPVYDVTVFRSEQMQWDTPQSSQTIWAYPSDKDWAAWNAELMLKELHYSVTAANDTAIENGALTSRVIVIPDHEILSDSIIDKLKNYVTDGGHLVVCARRNAERFGYDYFGALSPVVTNKSDYAGEGVLVNMLKNDLPQYFLSDDQDGAFPMDSTEWVLMKDFTPDAIPGEPVYTSYFLKKDMTDYKAWSTRPHGKGTATFVPFELFSFYQKKMMIPEMRKFFGRVMNDICPDRLVNIDAPAFVDVVLRKNSRGLILHILNGSTGNAGSNEARLTVSDIPTLHSIPVTLRLEKRPESILLPYENTALGFSVIPDGDNYLVRFTIPRLEIIASALVAM